MTSRACDGHVPQTSADHRCSTTSRTPVASVRVRPSGPRPAPARNASRPESPSRTHVTTSAAPSRRRRSTAAESRREPCPPRWWDGSTSSARSWPGATAAKPTTCAPAHATSTAKPGPGGEEMAAAHCSRMRTVSSASRTSSPSTSACPARHAPTWIAVIATSSPATAGRTETSAVSRKRLTAPPYAPGRGARSPPAERPQPCGGGGGERGQARVDDDRLPGADGLHGDERGEEGRGDERGGAGDALVREPVLGHEVPGELEGEAHRGRGEHDDPDGRAGHRDSSPGSAAGAAGRRRGPTWPMT